MSRKRGRPLIGDRPMTPTERKRRQREREREAAAKTLQTKSRGKRPRWKVLSPEGQGECDYDPETELAFADDNRAELRRNAAISEAIEARRLARDYALLRPDTERKEISTRRLREVKMAATAWNRLLRTIEKRRSAKEQRQHHKHSEDAE